MIQYNNFLMKREQSRAGSSFAECEKSRLKAKILITLALLLTAVTGAWADQTYTITFKANNKTKTIENVTLPHTFTSVNNQGNGELDLIINDLYNQSEGWCVETPTVSGNSNVTAGLDGSYNQYITISAPFEGNATVSGSHFYNNPISSFTYTLEISVESPTIDLTWDAKTQTGTFTMPAFDVEIDPIYAPTAEFATDGKPTAIEGIIAGEAKDIVKAGTVATTKIGEADPIAQGTVMYAVTTENKKPTSTTGFSATVPTGAALTGSYAEDQTVYVWYYIKGIDAAEGVTPTAENTFNDSEICETPLTVTLKANQFDLTLAPAPVKNMTVTVAGQAATPDQEGKVEAVKMQSEVKLKANTGYKFRKVEVKKGAPDVKIESFSIHTSSNDVYSSGTFTCSIIDILPANATNQTFEWKINSGAPAGTTIKTVSDDTKTVTILAGANPGSITIEATAKDGGGANKLMHITVME